MNKFLKILGIGLLVVFMISLISFAIFYNRFVIEAPKKEYSKPTNVKESQLQDLDYLSLYANRDRSFDTSDKRTAFFNQIDVLKSELPLESHQFIMGVAKIVAQADNTHTNLSPAWIGRQVNAIPLRFYWFGNNLHVVLAQSPYQNLLGKPIKQINGKTPLDLLKSLEEWYGGSKSRLKFFSPLYFMSPELMNAIGHGHAKNSIELTYENNYGEDNTLSIKASIVSKDDVGYWPPNWLNTTLMKSKDNWLTINNNLPAVPFQNTKKNVSHKFLEHGLYVQLNENANSKALNINDYLDGIMDKLKHKPLKFAILDLRFNPGGDYHIGRSFIKKINKKLNGNPFYLITGNGTFSAGIMTAAILKDTAKENSIIIGEAVGDRLQFWADGGSSMILPNSKIRLRIWTAYHDWQNGCDDWSKCFWVTIFDGVQVANLNLDFNVPLNYSDYLNGNDSVLNAVLEMEK